MGVHPVEVGLREEATSQTRLVGNEHQLEADALQAAKEGTKIRVEDQVLWARGVVARFDERPVAVEENGPVHGRASPHEVSTRPQRRWRRTTCISCTTAESAASTGSATSAAVARRDGVRPVTATTA